MAEAVQPSLPMVPSMENARKIRDVMLEKGTPDAGPAEGGSLTDLGGELGDQLKPVADMLARIRNILENINGNITFMSGKLIELFTKQNEAAEAKAAEKGVEDARGPAEVEVGADEKEVGVTVTQQAQGLFSTIFTGLKLLLAGKVLMDFLKINFPTLAEGIDEFFNNLVAGIRSFAAPAFIGGIVKIFTGIGKAIMGIGKLLKPAVGFLQTGGKVTKAIGPIGKFFGSVGKFLGGLGKLVPFASKLPGLNLIFAIIDIFKGFKKGEEEFGGVIGGIVGSIRELLIGFIGMPLDLLKKGIAFILKKLGFDEVAESLESFSFSDLISDIVGGIFNFFKNLGTNIKKLVNKVAKFIPGFDGFEIDPSDLSKEEREAERQKLQSGETDDEERKKIIDQLAEEGQASGDRSFEKKVGGVQTKLNKSFEDLTPEQQAQVTKKVEAAKAKKLAGLDEADNMEVQKNLEEQKKVEEAKKENLKKDEETIKETEDKLAKGPEVGTGAELKEKGQEPSTVALVNNQNVSPPQNIDNSTQVTNNTKATQVTRTPPVITTHNNDSSLFGAVASTYAV